MKPPTETHAAMIRFCYDTIVEADQTWVSARDFLARAKHRLGDLEAAQRDERKQGSTFSQIAQGTEEKP